MSAQLIIAGAHLLLERQGQVLLGKRSPDAAFGAGQWHVPAGHVERESVRACAVREAAEELGVTIAAHDLGLVHTVHLLDSDGHPRLQLFFRVHHWVGVPRLMEPDRCTEWSWWPRHALPDPTVPYTRVALEGIAQGWSYTDIGWPLQDRTGP